MINLGTKYTFLLPAYKACFLEQTLKSIQNQRYNDFKVLISDDCSPENLYSICKPYLEDPRFNYRRNTQNIGAEHLVVHWNMLVNLCDTEYLIMASDDDMYDPTFLDEVDKTIIQYPKTNLIYTGIKSVDRDGNILKETHLNSTFMSYEEFVKYLMFNAPITCLSHYVFRAPELKRIGGFIDFPLGWKSDEATPIKLSKEGVAIVSKNLSFFRTSEIQLSAHHLNDAKHDRLKLRSCLEFGNWAKNNIQIDPNIIEFILKSLEGEIRSYYWVCNIKYFFSIFFKLSNESWFRTPKNALSFIAGWIKVKLIKAK